MKKFFATFLAVALVAVACCVFASAEDVARLETKLRDGLPTVSATH